MKNGAIYSFCILITVISLIPSMQAASFQATGPTNETYGGSDSAPVIEVSFSNLTAEMHFQFPFYNLMIPGQITNGDDCMYFNGWAEGYDDPNENPGWNIAGNQYEPIAENDPGYSNCAYWVESQNPARIVVRHRYALIRSNVIYNAAWSNPIGKQGEWVDQWFIFSPDGTHIKKTRIYTQDATNCHPWVYDDPAEPNDRSLEVEGMYMMSFERPDHTVADDLETNYWTLIKMDGTAKDVPQDYPGDTLAQDFHGFDYANIQLINTDATNSLDPFRIGRDTVCFNSAYDSAFSESKDPIPHRQFHGSNSYHNGGIGDLYMVDHWQVKDDAYVTEIWLNGYTSAGDVDGNDGGEPAGPELAKLAKSWYYTPAINITNGAISATNDLAQRAYLIKKTGNGPIQGTIAASSGSPLINPTFLIKDWGNDSCSIAIGSRILTEGTNFHLGYYPTLTFEDDNMTNQTWNDVMIVWAEADETSPVTLIITPHANAPVIQQGASISVGIDEDETPTAWSPPTITATNPVGGSLTWSLGSGPLNGTAIVSGTGTNPSTLNYTPYSKFTGIDSFVVQVANTAAIDIITVNVVVTNSPDAPIAVDDDTTTPINSSKDIYVLSNDIERDGDDLTITDVGSPTYGDVVNNSTYLTYTPSNGIDGVTDIFSYTIDDGTGRTDDGIVSISIGGGTTGAFYSNLVVNTTNRLFHAYVPTTYDGSAMPLLFMFHDFENTSAIAASNRNWAATAEANGFMAIFPDSLDGLPPKTPENYQKYFDMPESYYTAAVNTNSMDLQFTIALLDWAKDNYNINEDRVFATGFTRGGQFAFHAASMYPDTFAAFGIYAAGGYGTPTNWSWGWPAYVPSDGNPKFNCIMIWNDDDPWVYDGINLATNLAVMLKDGGHNLEKHQNATGGHIWYDYYNQVQWDFFISTVTTTNGSVSKSWLEDQNASWASDYEGAVTNDHDGDGFTTLQEYWMGTNPQASNSFPLIQNITFDGSEVIITWQHSQVDMALPPLSIQQRTDLSYGNWLHAGEVTPVDGSNTWSGTGSQKMFYRLVNTNAP